MRQIDELHCQACGSTDEEDVGYRARRDRDGYTACCNERAVGGGRDVMDRPDNCNDEQGDCYHD